MTYTVEYDREARGWNVVDQSGQIIAIFNGGKKNKEKADKTAAFFNRAGA